VRAKQAAANASEVMIYVTIRNIASQFITRLLAVRAYCCTQNLAAV